MCIELLSDEFINVAKYMKAVTVSKHLEIEEEPRALFGVPFGSSGDVQLCRIGGLDLEMCAINEKYIKVRMKLDRKINYPPSILLNNIKYTPLYTYHNNNIITFVTPTAAVLSGCICDVTSSDPSLFVFVECKNGVKIERLENREFNIGDEICVVYVKEEIDNIIDNNIDIVVGNNNNEEEEDIIDIIDNIDNDSMGDMMIDQVTKSNRLFEWAKPIVDDIFDNNKRIVMVAPTGEGKTRIGLYAMERAMLENDVGDEPVIKEVILFVAPYTIPIQQVSTKAMRMQGHRRPLLARAMWSTVVGGNKVKEFYKKSVATALSGRVPQFDDPYLEINDNGIKNSKKRLNAEVFICTTEMANIMLKDDNIKKYLSDKNVTVVFDEVQECFDTSSSRFPAHAEFLDLTGDYRFIGLTGTYGMCSSSGNNTALRALGIETRVFPRVPRAICDVSDKNDIRKVIYNIKSYLTHYTQSNNILNIEPTHEHQRAMIDILGESPQVTALMNIVFDSSRGSAALFINYKNDLEYIRNNFVFLVWAYQTATMENGRVCKYPRMFPLYYIPRKINENGEVYSLGESIRIEKSFGDDKKSGAKARREYENSFDYRETHGSSAYYKYLNKKLPTAIELREMENNKGYKSHSLFNKKDSRRPISLRFQYNKIDMVEGDRIETVDVEFEEQSQRVCDCLGVLRATRDSDDIDQLIMEFQKSHNHPALWLCTQKMGVGADLPDLRLLVIGKSRKAITQTLLDQVMGRVDRERNSYMVYNELGRDDIIDNTDLDRADISEIYSFLEVCSDDFRNIIKEIEMCEDDMYIINKMFKGENSEGMNMKRMNMRELFNYMINNKISNEQTIISPEAQISIVKGYEVLKEEMDEYLEYEKRGEYYKWKNSIMFNIMSIIRKFLSTTAPGFEYGCAAPELIRNFGRGDYIGAQSVANTYKELEFTLNTMRKDAKTAKSLQKRQALSKKADAFAESSSRITTLIVIASRAIIIYKESKNMDMKINGISDAVAKYIYIALLSAVNAKRPNFLSLPQLYQLKSNDVNLEREDIINKINDINEREIENKEELIEILKDELEDIDDSMPTRYITVSDNSLPSFTEISNYINYKKVVDDLYKFGIEFKIEKMCPYGLLPFVPKDNVKGVKKIKGIVNNMISSVGILGDNLVCMPQCDDDPELQPVDLNIKEKVVCVKGEYIKKKYVNYDIRKRCLDIDNYKKMVDSYVSGMTNDEAFLASSIVLSILRDEHPKMRAQFEDIQRLSEDNYAVTSLTLRHVNKSRTAQESANGALDKRDNDDDEILIDKIKETMDDLNSMSLEDNGFGLSVYEKVVMMMYPAVYAHVGIHKKRGISLPRCVTGVDIVSDLGILRKSVAALSAIQDMPPKERYKRMQAGGITSGSNDDSVAIKVLMDCESVRKYAKHLNDNHFDINSYADQLLFPLHLLIKLSDKVGSGYGVKIDCHNISSNKTAAVNTFITMCSLLGGENANRLVVDYTVALAIPRCFHDDDTQTIRDIEDKDIINILTSHISPNTHDIPRHFIHKLQHFSPDAISKASIQADSCLLHVIDEVLNSNPTPTIDNIETDLDDFIL